MSSSQEEGGEFDYLQLILRRKLLIAGITLTAAITALIISAYQQKIYQTSAILQVGAIAEQNASLEIHRTPIEDTKTVSELLRTDSMMVRLKGKLQLPDTVSITSLKNAIKIRIIKNDIVNQSTQLIEVSMTAPDPQKTVDGLNFLMEQFIEEHTKRYDAAITVFMNRLQLIDDKLKHNQAQQQEVREKVEKSNEQINVDKRYRKVIEQQIRTSEQSVRETKERLAALDPKTISPLEILFLQSELRNQEEHYADLQKDLNALDLEINERQKQINDLENQITSLASQSEDLKSGKVSIENYKNLSENTRVRSAPVLPTRHISPNVRNNVVVGGGVGFLLSVLIAFSLEYSLAEKRRRG